MSDIEFVQGLGRKRWFAYWKIKIDDQTFQLKFFPMGYHTYRTYDSTKRFK